MGMTGVAAGLADALHYNPANLAWPTAEYVRVSFNPVAAELHGSHQLKYRSESLTFALPRLGPKWLSGSVGYEHTAFRVHWHYWWPPETPVEGPDYEHFWSSDSHQFAFGVGFDGPVKVGVGFGLKWVKERYPGFEGSGTAVDLGALLRLPILTPSNPDRGRAKSGVCADLVVGASVLNNGSDIIGALHSTRLPKVGRYGITMGLRYSGDRRVWLGLYPVIEKEIPQDSPDSARVLLGAGLAFVEIVCLRVGRVNLGSAYSRSAVDHTTYGLGFSTAGLRSPSGGEDAEGVGSVFRYLLYNLNIQLLYAHVEPEFEGWEGTDYYGFEIAL
jgi:hypothetical protein